MVHIFGTGICEDSHVSRRERDFRMRDDFPSGSLKHTSQGSMKECMKPLLISHHFIGYSTDLVQCPNFCTRPAVRLSEDSTILVLRTSASTATVTDLRGWIVDVHLLSIDICKARLQGGSMQVVGAHRPPSVPTISKLDCAAACKLQRNCRLPQRSDGLKQHLQQASSSRAGWGRKSLRYVLTHPECRPYLHGSQKEKRCHCLV